jgi:hypothetical protein
MMPAVAAITFAAAMAAITTAAFATAVITTVAFATAVITTAAVATIATTVAVFSLMAVTFVVLAATLAVVTFTVLVEACTPATPSEPCELTATGQRHRATGAEGEESDCYCRRQA